MIQHSSTYGTVISCEDLLSETPSGLSKHKNMFFINFILNLNIRDYTF